MRRTIDPTYTTTIIADCHGIQDSDIHTAIKEQLHQLAEYRKNQIWEATWRVVPPAEAASKLQVREDDFQHTPENPEPEVPWMKWGRGVKLKVTRFIPVKTFLGTQTELKDGTIVTVAEATRSHVSIYTLDGFAYHVAGSNCCYLEWWADPQPENPEQEPPWMAWRIGSKLRATRTIPTYCSSIDWLWDTFTAVSAGTYLVLSDATRANIHAIDKSGNEHLIDGSNCRYLEMVQVDA